MKASEGSGINSFGWYGSVMDMAGTPDRLRAIESSNVIDFFVILSYNKAKAKYNELYQKQ